MSAPRRALAFQPAQRYRCPTEDGHAGHTHGDGRMPRRTCARCGARLAQETGMYGLFEWREDGVYPNTATLARFRTRKAADHAADNIGGLVVRWITINTS